MSFPLRILPRAEADAQAIFDYLAKRSPAGAAAWWEAYEAAMTMAAVAPHQCGRAPESPVLGLEVRQKLFQTKRGRVYRGVFVVVGDEVRILRVRGPGQRPMTEDELSL